MNSKSAFSSVNEYLESLPENRREALEQVRTTVLDNIPQGYEECIQYGMISYIVPMEKFSQTYNNQPLALLSIGNQKNHMALYLNNVYSDPELKEWFETAYKATGKKLDMGKSCVRFKKLDNLPLDVIGEVVSKTTPDQFIELYKQAKSTGRRKK